MHYQENHQIGPDKYPKCIYTNMENIRDVFWLAKGCQGLDVNGNSFKYKRFLKTFIVATVESKPNLRKELWLNARYNDHYNRTNVFMFLCETTFFLPYSPCSIASNRRSSLIISIKISVTDPLLFHPISFISFIALIIIN